ncbi:MAG TPA: outer membrane beta-barrel domain-containing protein [Polyangia bacterium]|nr:outer membrane beta-barrel domain-containing protein [Polyangia bacterium]
MKRPAISLLVCAALVGWAATGHAKKGGGGKAGTDTGTDSSGDVAQAGDAPAGDQAGATDQSAAGGKDSAAPSESLEGEEAQPGKVEEDVGGAKATVKTTTLSWNDIVVIPRKAFLKGGRLELQPFTGITINDNLIRHYVVGGDINYFLTDVFWVGLEGQYYIHQLTNEEELLGSEFNLAPTLNQYLYGGALNFGYVPVYGKFAFFKSIVSWEIWASAGIGVTWTKVIARDPANDAVAFTNTDLTPNVGLGSRFFLLDWMTVNFGLRDYILPDKFEPKPNTYSTVADAKAHAQSALVNNVMFSVGIGIYLPTKFQYKTPR